MELYKIELYKLIHRKFFLISLSGIFAVLLLYFCFVNIGGERSTVNGVVYTGLQAIKKDREITEAFQGILTDDKAEQIMESYGFPSAVSENYGGFRDENYLNGLITEYLGNGYFYRSPLLCFPSPRQSWEKPRNWQEKNFCWTIRKAGLYFLICFSLEWCSEAFCSSSGCLLCLRKNTRPGCLPCFLRAKRGKAEILQPKPPHLLH